MKRLLPLFGWALAAALIVGGGVVHGFISERWGVDPRGQKLAARFAMLPKQYGSWKLLEAGDLSEAAAEQLRCHAFVNHTYVNQLTQEVVRVAVLMGPPGPIAVHTPEICFTSRDYAIDNSRQAIRLTATDDQPDELWSLRFRSRDVSAQYLKVYYGWTVDGVWQAAENPRFAFGGTSYLFKIQVATIVPEDQSQAMDPGQMFLQEFTPLLRQHLFQADLPTEDRT